MGNVINYQISNMAKTKAGGATRLGRDSLPKYLGVKIFAGQKVKSGNIIVRQRGTPFLAGNGVREGADNTLYAVKDGKVSFRTKNKTRFDGNKKTARIVSVD